MIEVTRTTYYYPDGTKRVEKLSLYVMDRASLESKRRRDCRNLGCERIVYRYHEKINN